MTEKEIVDLLNKDFVGEIEAILTYLRHFLIIKECEPSREIEEISLDEMRHVEWLGDMITKLGGEPEINHAKLDFGGRRMDDMLFRDVALEEGAIKQYQKHINAIDDPKVKKLLTKIKMEEEEHLGKFKELIEEI